jgi:hypothetical protein
LLNKEAKMGYKTYEEVFKKKAVEMMPKDVDEIEV